VPNGYIDKASLSRVEETKGEKEKKKREKERKRGGAGAKFELPLFSLASLVSFL